MSVTFDQVFWYTNACPLRQVNEPALIEESQRCKRVRELVHGSLLALMAGRITTEEAMGNLVNVISQNKPTHSRFTGGDNLIITDLVYSALWAASTWNKYRGVKPDDVIDMDKSFTARDMDAHVDMVRFKRAGEVSYLNLTWINYNMDMPNSEERGRLFQYVQYHARAYELVTDTRPTQLDIFFPFLNHTFYFVYNPETSYEIVAGLIADEQFYAIPSPECNICQMCPMEWDLRGLPKTKKNLK